MGRIKSVQTKKIYGENNQKRGELQGEVILVMMITVGFVLAVSIYTKQAGLIGKFLYRLTAGLLGCSAYLIPLGIIIYSGFLLMKIVENYKAYKIWTYAGILMIISIFSHLMQANPYIPPQINIISYGRFYFEIGSLRNGGVIGALLGSGLLKILGVYGTYIFLSSFMLILCILLTGKSFVQGMIQIVTALGHSITYIKNCIAAFVRKKAPKVPKVPKEKKKVELIKNNKAESPVEFVTPTINKDQEISDIKVIGFSQNQPKTKTITDQAYKEIVDVKKECVVTKEIDIGQEASIPAEKLNYSYPSIELLYKNTMVASMDSKSQILQNAKKLEDTLMSFGVEAKVLEISRGPTVTRYELQPSQGVKVSRIVNLADDIALNLAASGIRIEAPIPGKAAVGIEVPNQETQPVFLREVLEDEAFNQFPSKLAFALGKDIAGNVVVGDIAKMPHLLIAGATGSGKSVCINTLITSIIYKANPNEVKLLMIDPKVVELSIYNGIPHLMIPVVTDPKKAAGALNWAVQEMITRYKLFADHTVRDLKGYNEMKEKKQEEGFLPQIVIIIDELADLMMAAPGEVEDAICRLAQMARAAGLHLVIATQRPSVDVITGVIKANIPSRLAFAVSSGIDSRTILDMNGAEKLLGKGDMLFYPVGMSKPQRIQGAFISDKEVENIVAYVKQGQTPEYNQDMIEEMTATTTLPGAQESGDEYLQQAIELVVEKEKASVSMLQRVFRIGYNRAARLMEELEQKGIVGKEDGSKPRKVLMTQRELEILNQEKQELST